MGRVDKKKSDSGRNRVLPDFPLIEGYRFLQTIARSAKSEVYVAYSEELRHNVAIKILLTGPHSNADASEEDRFERERDMLIRVKHSAIIDIYDWGRTADFRYIVTEYFPSGSLELRIRNLMTMRDSI